jgi:Rieske 2Fe-2S family protein
VTDRRSSYRRTTTDTTRIPTELQRTLPAFAYLSAEWFERERERIFLREWFCVGRADILQAPGAYLMVVVAGESVLVVRTRAGDLRAFYNVCRHRGSQLVPENGVKSGAPAGSGRFKGAIVCPYHAWTYGLEGELRSAPFLNESVGLRREQLSLCPVAVDSWGGFLFLTLEPTEPDGRDRSLTAHLGAVPDRLARYPLAELRSGRRITYEVSANWKCIVENYNECYHCGPVHPELCEIVPAFKRQGGADLDWENGVPHREGATTFTFTGTTSREPFPDLSEGERVRHKGELIYPNLMLSLSADHVAAFTLWPKGADRTVIDCDFLFHPDEMSKRGFDPSDAVEFWDLVNRQDWRICESVQRGMGSRAYSYGYYAPMEDLSLDIRRYVADRLGPSSERW